MKAKKVIQRALPLDVKYTLNGVSYLSLEDGGGCSCDNCGRLITNMANVKSSKGSYTIGLDCLDSIIINNDLLEGESYLQYLYSDKPAIQKAKSLRSKLLKKSKEDANYKATLKDFNDKFGFYFETTRNGIFDPQGWDYTFNPEYRELTVNYLKGLNNVILG